MCTTCAPTASHQRAASATDTQLSQPTQPTTSTCWRISGSRYVNTHLLLYASRVTGGGCTIDRPFAHGGREGSTTHTGGPVDSSRANLVQSFVLVISEALTLIRSSASSGGCGQEKKKSSHAFPCSPSFGDVGSAAPRNHLWLASRFLGSKRG